VWSFKNIPNLNYLHGFFNKLWLGFYDPNDSCIHDGWSHLINWHNDWWWCTPWNGPLEKFGDSSPKLHWIHWSLDDEHWTIWWLVMTLDFPHHLMDVGAWIDDVALMMIVCLFGEVMETLSLMRYWFWPWTSHMWRWHHLGDDGHMLEPT